MKMLSLIVVVCTFTVTTVGCATTPAASHDTVDLTERVRVTETHCQKISTDCQSRQPKVTGECFSYRAIGDPREECTPGFLKEIEKQQLLPPPEPPFYEKAWFWGVLGSAILVGGATAGALGYCCAVEGCGDRTTIRLPR